MNELGHLDFEQTEWTGASRLWMMICSRLSFDMLVLFKMCKKYWCCAQNDITILFKHGIEICYGYYSCFYTLIKVMLNNFSRFVDSDILILNNKTCEWLEIHSAHIRALTDTKSQQLVFIQFATCRKTHRRNQ